MSTLQGTLKEKGVLAREKRKGKEDKNRIKWFDFSDRDIDAHKEGARYL